MIKTPLAPPASRSAIPSLGYCAAHATVKDVPTYRDRVMGCWLGKAVGGTLGMPFEGVDGPLELSFYEPVPTEMLPNDDLDLQVVWACVLDQMETPAVDRHILANAWKEHVHFPWDEYGVALRNQANGLHPPLTGSHDNWFKHGMGAPIRSEIWACLAPGNPALAAAYAREDACFDHEGVGIDGEVFFAALQSMAFVESNTDILLDNALNTLPEDSPLLLAIEDTRRWWAESHDWLAVRNLILRHHGHENFTDATMNVAFTILGWLAGEGDFSRAICIAVNCGKDTDCTGATVGALMGILDPDCIPHRWLAPIGRDLVLSPGIVNLKAPKSLDAFTDLVQSLRSRLGEKWPDPEVIEQRAAHLAVAAEIGYAASLLARAEDAPELRRVDLPGYSVVWPNSSFEGECLVVRYRFELPAAQDVKLMFNTPVHCRVWLDGQILFEREGGRMAPSFHRAPENQWATASLAAGTHELLAAVARPASGLDVEWVAGVGDAATDQWIARAFLAEGA